MASRTAHDWSSPRSARAAFAPAVAVGQTDTFRFARISLIVLAATALDVTNFLDRGNDLRYLLLVFPFAAILWLRLSRPSPVFRRPAVADKVLFITMLFGLAGTFYGILFKDITATARPLFLPMLAAFLYLGTLQDPAEEETERLTRLIAAIGVAYICLNALVNSGVVDQLAVFRQFKNASFPFVAMGLAAAYILHRRKIFVGLCVLTLLIFMGYPSATSALILVVTILTFFMTSPRGTSFRPYAVGIVVIAILGLSLANFSQTLTLTGKYFEAVNVKRNTEKGRLAFWANGLEEFRQSPIVGTAFSSETVTQVSATRIAPYHNDFILFMAKGGIVGLLLLLSWIIALERTLLRRYFGFLRAGESSHAALLRLLLVGFNAFFVSMMFNPVLQGFSRSATIFAMYGIAMAVGGPAGSLPAARPARVPARR